MNMMLFKYKAQLAMLQEINKEFKEMTIEQVISHLSSIIDHYKEDDTL